MDKEIIKNIKQQFFTYRNGLIADKLRSCGDTHKIIFGLNLPQIINIANMVDKSPVIADFLWNNDSTRESQVIAPMLYPVELFDIAKAEQWIETLYNEEIADMLCHKLLRHTDYAEDLCNRNFNSDNNLKRYLAYRLALNLVMLNKYSHIQELKTIAQSELDINCKSTQEVAKAIIDEISFRLKPNL